MATLVVPFRGLAEGKSRLGLATRSQRTALARAMLADVVAACAGVGPTFVVTPDVGPVAGSTVVADPGRGQGAAVRAGLTAAGSAGGSPPFLVVNADLPCATSRDLLALAQAVPDGGLALSAAADGTTNALAFASIDLFVPLYGAASAERFAASAPSRVTAVPNLIDDVDTVADLERLRTRLGPHTSSVLAALQLGAAA